MTGVAEMDVSPQEEMPNPQGITMFAVERRGLPEDFAIRICAKLADCLGSTITVVGTGRDSVLQVCVLLS